MQGLLRNSFHVLNGHIGQACLTPKHMVLSAFPAFCPRFKWAFLLFLCYAYIPGNSYTILPSGSLQIARAAAEDAGTYICVAQNPAGTALGKIKLKIQGMFCW